MRWLALAALLVCGCVHARKIRQGATVRGTTEWRDVERMIALSGHAFFVATGQPAGSVDGYVIRFLDYRPGCGSGDCHGVVIGDQVLLRSERCIPVTSLAHELMHIYHLQAFGHYDAMHANRLLWEGSDAAVWRAVAAGVHEGMCG